MYTGKLIIGKLSEFFGVCPINSDKFTGSDKLPGSGLRFNSDKFIGIYRLVLALTGFRLVLLAPKSNAAKITKSTLATYQISSV